jgi:hypothetical protein
MVRSGLAQERADIFTIEDRRSFANLSPRIRIFNQLTVPGGDPAGWSGRANRSEFLAHWLHFIRGSVR